MLQLTSIDAGLQKLPGKTSCFGLSASGSQKGETVWSCGFDPPSDRLVASPKLLSTTEGLEACYRHNDVAVCGLIRDLASIASDARAQVLYGKLGVVGGREYASSAFVAQGERVESFPVVNAYECMQKCEAASCVGATYDDRRGLCAVHTGRLSAPGDAQPPPRRALADELALVPLGG